MRRTIDLVIAGYHDWQQSAKKRLSSISNERLLNIGKPSFVDYLWLLL